MKAGLRKVLGRALVTVEELHTIVVEVESSINDRPLTYVDSDVKELNVITPSQLIRGRRLRAFHTPCDINELSDPSYCTTKSLQERVQYTMTLSKNLWKRWVSEYLLALRESHKCLIKGNNDTWPRAGDIVLIHDDGPRSQWKLSKITGLHAGRDGLIRVAT